MAGAFLGLDAGLSGTKAAVLATDGRLLGGAVASLPAVMPEPNWLDPEALYRSVLTAGRTAIHAAGNPPLAAIAIGALGPCPVLLDEQGASLGLSPIFSRETSAESFRQELLQSHQLKQSELGPDHVLAKLMWSKVHAPERFAKARLVTDIAGFLTGRLTGVFTMDGITCGDHTAPGVPQPVPLPQPELPDHIAGSLTAAAAQELQVRSGIPVAVGCYDSFADILGVGCTKVGDAAMLLGSTLVIGRASTVFTVDEDLRLSPYIGNGNFVSGWTSAAASLINWSAQLYGKAAAEAAAELPPGAGGLIMLPYFAGERAPVWDPLARGTLIGMTLRTAPAELHRAAIDAVALSAMDLGMRIANAAGKAASYRVTGGASHNAALTQAIADALDTPLAIMAYAGEAVGPAVLAARAVGRTLSIPLSREMMPEAARHARYLDLLSLYRPLYARLQDTMHALGRFNTGAGHD